MKITISTDVCHYNDKRFATEFSTLWGNTEEKHDFKENRFKIPLTVWLRSSKTGKSLPFTFVKNERDREGDLTATLYSCYEGFNLTVYND